MSGHRSTSGSVRWGAISLAYLIVFQAVVTGLISGAHAAVVAVDRTIALTHCATSAPGFGGASDHAQPDLMLDCALSCAFSANIAITPAASFFPVSYRVANHTGFTPYPLVPPGFYSGHFPANPRAPPA